MRGSLISSAYCTGWCSPGCWSASARPEVLRRRGRRGAAGRHRADREMTQIQQGDKNAPIAEKSAPVPTKSRLPERPERRRERGRPEVRCPSRSKSRPRPNPRSPEKVREGPSRRRSARRHQGHHKERDGRRPADRSRQGRSRSAEVKPEPKPERRRPKRLRPRRAEPTASRSPKSRSRPRRSRTRQPKTPKTETKKKDVKKEKTKSKSTKESDFNADEIAALLNKPRPTAGGAKRSTDKAALGGKKTTGGSKLSQSEMDALRGQIQNNWSVIPGLADATTSASRCRFQLDQSGELIGEPEVTATGGTPQTRTGAGGRRAPRGPEFRPLQQAAPRTSTTPGPK